MSPNRCTEGKNFKTVKFGLHTTYVPVRMYGSPRHPLQQIPDVGQPDHYHTYGRVRHAPAQVAVFIHRDKALQKEQMRTSEQTLRHHQVLRWRRLFSVQGKGKGGRRNRAHVPELQRKLSM